MRTRDLRPIGERESAPKRSLRVVAVLALLGIGIVHLNLYARQDYHFIPTIGPLFIVTAVAAGLIAIGFAVRPHWVLALAGISLSVGTLAGYIWTLEGTLFKFHEPGVSTSGVLAIIFEIVATAALAAWILLSKDPVPFAHRNEASRAPSRRDRHHRASRFAGRRRTLRSAHSDAAGIPVAGLAVAEAHEVEVAARAEAGTHRHAATMVDEPPCHSCPRR